MDWATLLKEFGITGIVAGILYFVIKKVMNQMTLQGSTIKELMTMIKEINTTWQTTTSNINTAWQQMFEKWHTDFETHRREVATVHTYEKTEHAEMLKALTQVRCDHQVMLEAFTELLGHSRRLVKKQGKKK